MVNSTSYLFLPASSTLPRQDQSLAVNRQLMMMDALMKGEFVSHFHVYSRNHLAN